MFFILNYFDTEKYLVDHSVQNNDWIFPSFIAFYFGFEDLVPIIVQIISAWRSIEDRKAYNKSALYSKLISHTEFEKSLSYSDYYNQSSMQSNSQNNLSELEKSENYLH